MNSPPIAQTALGDLRGGVEGGVAVFRGVPYAAAPTGELRFMPPQPPHAWIGLRDAGRHGPIAPQLPTTIIHVMGDIDSPQDEDCLTLTIWTPAADDRRRPVLVWLHGGSFTSGAGSLDWYNGSGLARDGDLVVVGVNYRLGALGFLCREGICDGNQGVLDQAAALRWVAAHIASFGGDPDRVTVAGQSAGAHAIARLATMPDARPHFRRAILQSGAFARPASIAADMLPTSDVFLQELGIDAEAADAASQLRRIPPDRILQAQAVALRLGDQLGGAREAFRPVLPVRETPRQRISAIAEGLSDLDVMVGITANETHAFIGRPELPDHSASFVAEQLHALTGRADALEWYQARYPGSTRRNLLCEIMSQHSYYGPTAELADALVGSASRVFGYVFDWAPPASRYKACHCIDIPFVFGNFDMWGNPGMLAGGNAAEMAALSRAVQRAWFGFIRDGTPEPHPLIPWPRYHQGDRRVMRFGRTIDVGGSFTAR